ncbi:hypothetical protein CMK18_18225 [Candidatus Poribacteria bacterium]|nr:hypothetical protein [Candidatus Poribacteria bacterium]
MIKLTDQSAASVELFVCISENNITINLARFLSHDGSVRIQNFLGFEFLAVGARPKYRKYGTTSQTTAGNTGRSVYSYHRKIKP